MNIIKKCEICNKDFKAAKYLENKRKYCSQICAKQSLKRTITLNCDHCKKTFDMKLGHHKFRKGYGTKKFFCSKDCQNKSQITGVNDLLDTICTYCNNPIKRVRRLIEKTDIHFCNRHCQGNYYSKTFGSNKRSLLEKKIEEYIKKDYPLLNVIFGDREQCYTMELDIYVPSLNLAFEINGPIHHKPIYGEEPLKTIQNKDNIKQKICKTKNINLVIINDVLNYYKDNSKEIYENKIKTKIDERIVKTTKYLK